MQTFCQPFLLYSACEAVSYLFLSPANSLSLSLVCLVLSPSRSSPGNVRRRFACLSAFLLCLFMQFTGSADRLPPATPPPLPPDCLLPPILNAITLTHFWHKQFLDQARPGLSNLIRNVCQTLDFLLSFLFSPTQIAAVICLWVCLCVVPLFLVCPLLLFFLFFLYLHWVGHLSHPNSR